MDNTYFEELLEEKEKELRRAEEAIEACQKEIHRLRNVCRSYEEEMRISENCEQFSIEDVLKRLGAHIAITTEGDSEKVFTQEGKIAYEDLKKILLVVEKVTGIDVRKIIGLLDDLVLQNEDQIELSQLCFLLRIFDEYGRKGKYSVGKWTISNGGYDLWFEICYNQMVVVQCIAGRIVMIRDLKINKELILNCILEEYKDLTT